MDGYHMLPPILVSPTPNDQPKPRWRSWILQLIEAILRMAQPRPGYFGAVFRGSFRCSCVFVITLRGGKETPTEPKIVKNNDKISNFQGYGSVCLDFWLPRDPSPWAPGSCCATAWPTNRSCPASLRWEAT